MPATFLKARASLHNILLADDGRLLLVDWDGIMLAPRERDLTFFTGREQTEMGKIEKEHALKEFYRLFAEGDVVQAAYEADY